MEKEQGTERAGWEGKEKKHHAKYGGPEHGADKSASRACIRVSVHALITYAIYARAHTHTYIYTYTHTRARFRIDYLYLHVHLYASIRDYPRARARARSHVRGR